MSASQSLGWPQWRGPTQDGVVPGGKYPIHWSKTNNIRWRTPLPDRGNSTPIVVGDKIFVTQAVEKEHQRQIFCLDRRTGTILWKAGTTYELPEETHDTNPYCAASPVSDGERVIATFASAGVHAYDLNGKLLWTRDLGKQSHGWGNASSPLIFQDRCLVFHGPGKETALYALNKETGEILWKKPLSEPVPTVRTDGFKGQLPGVIGSFATPLILTAGNRTSVILGLPEEVRSVDPMNGADQWSLDGLNPLVYASPTVGEGILVAAGGFFGSTVAMRMKADPSQAPEKLWHEERAKKNRLGSPVIRNGLVFFVTMDGIVECIELGTGHLVWTERLKGPNAKGDNWSSPTLVGDTLYAVNQSGDAFLFKAGRRYELVATNTVGEHTNSSFAFADGDLFLRTWESLWCIAGGTHEQGVRKH